MSKYEYTYDEAKDIQNTLKKHRKLIDELLNMEDLLLSKRVHKIYDNELSYITEEIHCQAWGIDQEVLYLDMCFEGQSIPFFRYEDSFEQDKEMVKQIRKLIKHFNNKPIVNYRYA
jgi:hypothetical protein